MPEDSFLKQASGVGYPPLGQTASEAATQTPLLPRLNDEVVRAREIREAVIEIGHRLGLRYPELPSHPPVQGSATANMPSANQLLMELRNAQMVTAALLEVGLKQI